MLRERERERERERNKEAFPVIHFFFTKTDLSDEYEGVITKITKLSKFTFDVVLIVFFFGLRLKALYLLLL